MNINDNVKKNNNRMQNAGIRHNLENQNNFNRNGIFDIQKMNDLSDFGFSFKSDISKNGIFEGINRNGSVNQSEKYDTENDNFLINFNKTANDEKKVNGKNLNKPDVIKKQLFKDLNTKPVSKEDFKEHISHITKDNVRDVLSLYGKQSKDGRLFSAVIRNTDLDIDTKKQAIFHISDKLAEYCKENGIKSDDIENDLEGELNQTCLIKTKGKRLDEIEERFEDRIKHTYKDKSEEKSFGKLKSLTAPNGKVDGEFKQNAVGDCWLLSGIKSISNNPASLKILNDNLKYNEDDGSVSVTLKGVNKTITVSREELYGSSELSKGDLDIRAIEIATNKHFQEEYHKSSKSLCKISPPRADINGNSSVKAYELLLGIKGEHKPVRQDNVSDFVNNYIKDNNHLVVVSRHYKPDERTIDGKGKNVLVYSHHAYSVAGADDKFVYIINPHDSSKKIPLTYKQFGQIFDEADIAEIPQN